MHHSGAVPVFFFQRWSLTSRCTPATIPNRIPGAAFASNAHVGALVLQLCAAARERRHEDERCARLIVRKASQESYAGWAAVHWNALTDPGQLGTLKLQPTSLD